MVVICCSKIKHAYQLDLALLVLRMLAVAPSDVSMTMAICGHKGTFERYLKQYASLLIFQDFVQVPY